MPKENKQFEEEVSEIREKLEKVESSLKKQAAKQTTTKASTLELNDSVEELKQNLSSLQTIMQERLKSLYELVTKLR